jgi:hypothetical protein
VGLDVVSPHDGFTQFRGGCSAAILKDRVVGFGHLTLDSGRHSPFQWVFSPSNGQVSLSFDLDTRPLADLGMKVIDPTCFFAFQEKLYLGVNCSNRDWFYGQTFLSLLLELQTEGNSLRTIGSLASAIKCEIPVQESIGPGNQTVHFYRAAELQVGNGIRSHNFEVVSRAGKDGAGHIIYGPYINLKTGIYQLRLQYACAAASSLEVGEMDACGSSGSNIFAKKQLFGTNGKLFISTIDFRISEDRQGLQFEARVGSKGVADMRLTDISISRL